MRHEQRYKVMTYLLVWTLLFSTLAFGQQSRRADAARTSSVETETLSYPDYLLEISAGYDTGREYSKESQTIASLLSSNSAKSPILIDDQGYARDTVLQAVAARLAEISQGTKLFRINWNAVFSSDKGQAEIDATLNGIVKYAAASTGKTVIYLDDIASFSSETPILGAHVAAILYNALSQGKIRILSASDAKSFEQQITHDNRLQARFQRIDIAKNNDDDGFVGDKLSPDLRALVAGADQNKTVKVILQSNDINNPELLKVLKRTGVLIGDRATSLNMLAIDMPVAAAEEIAALPEAKHLSLDKEIQSLGHIETTTGVSLVRTQTTTVNNVTSTYQLNGTGVGVAVLDSGVFEQHHMFLDASGVDRVIKSVNFAGNANDVNYDPYGHGSHVAGIVAGGSGRSNEFANYRNIATNTKIINVRVLDDHGTGTTAGLIQGDISPRAICEGALVAAAIALVGAAFPAWRCAHLPIADTMREA